MQPNASLSGRLWKSSAVTPSLLLLPRLSLRMAVRKLVGVTLMPGEDTIHEGIHRGPHIQVL